MNDKPTILVVDDEANVREALIDTLTMEGYRVRPAESGEIALAAVDSESPDLVLLDIGLQGMDGFEVCRRLKAGAQTRHIPVIFLSGRADVANRIKGMEVGAADYLAKPFSAAELLARVRIQLALNRASLSLEEQASALLRSNEQLQAEIAKRQRVEDELRRSLERADRSRRAMLSTLEDQKRAEAQTAIRARQQEAIAELGQIALGDVELTALMDQAVGVVARVLDTELVKVLELLPDRSAVLLRAGVGWDEGLVGRCKVGVGLDSQAGYTLQSKEPVIVDDMQTETRFSGPQLLRDHGVVSGLSALIGDPDKPYGILGAHTRRRRAFSVHDVHFLRGVAHLLAAAVQRQGHETEIARLNRLYATLSQVDQTIVRCQSRSELFEDICRIVVEFGRVTAAWIRWKGEDGAPPAALAQHASNAKPGLVMPGWRSGCGVVAEALRTGRPCLCTDSHNDPRAAGCCDSLFPQSSRACAAFPLRMGGELCATLSICAVEPDFFGGAEILLLDEVADDISFALDKLDKEERRKLAEAERERLITAIEQTSEAIVITDPEGAIQYVNPAFEVVTGYSQQEAIGNTPRILRSGEHDEAFYRELWKTIRSRRPWRGRMVNRRKDGTLYTEEATISPVCDASGRLVNFVAVQRDITAHLLLEEQLRVALKMDAIGSLAGGIAHDFNNLLSVIQSYTQFALEDLRDGDPLKDDLTEVKRAGERATALTRQLLAFSRKQVLTPQVLDLNRVVFDLEKMLTRLIGEHIDLVQRLAPDLGRVKADPGQIEQVIVNLVVNARDAMPDGGTLTIETSNVEIDERSTPRQLPLKPGSYVLLAISDTGHGMDAATLPRLFEPFFTTKAKGKGTGLGLCTVYGILKQSGGDIYAESEPGKGSTFRALLPREAQDVDTPPASRAPARVAAGEETILLVEDEEAVRKVTARMLRAAGYKVLAAAHGGEALLICEQHPEAIHLLLTDVVMPQMSGRQLAERLLKVRPSLRVIYMSGYTDDAISHHGVLDPGTRFIAKPFSASDLARKVREALDDDFAR